MFLSVMFLWLYFSQTFMLTKKAVLDFKDLIEKDLGEEITYAQAEKWAENFYQLMLLITTPPEHHQ